MSLGMYEASIPVLIRTLENLNQILEKGVQFAETKNIDPAVLINARLAPDMYPLSRQVQIATDVAKGGAARLAGLEVPSYSDDEQTFAQLQARVSKTIAFIQSVTAEQLQDSETKAISVKTPSRELNFLGQPYLLNFVLPNVYFHITTTYAILRHNGVELGKADFIGAL